MSDWTPWKWVGDGLSVTAIVGAIVGALPVFAAFVGIVYYCIQCYESQTVQRWLNTRRERKIAELKVTLAKFEAQRLKRLNDPQRNTPDSC